MIRLLYLVLTLFFFTCCNSQSLETFANNSKGNQSAASYGKYLFLVKDKLASVAIYNLEQKKVSCVAAMPPRNELNGKNTVYHCNQSSFGVEKFVETDSFPLLYVSQRNRSSREGAIVSVLRVLPTFSQNDMVAVSFQEVQTIFFPVMNDRNCLGNPNVAFDVNEKLMYVYSRNNRKEASNRHQAKLSVFNIPSLRDDSGNVRTVVNLSDADILSAFDSDFSMVNAQGACVVNGTLYIAQLYSDRKNPKGALLHKIDMKSHARSAVDLSALGFKGEVEGCWFYNGNLMFSSSGKMLYLLRNFD